MGRLLTALLVVVALWAMWWPIMAWRETAATEDWLENRRAEGWQAEAAAIATTGFPLRYTREIAGVALADPATGWAWQADMVLLTRPRHPQLSEAGYVLTLPAIQQVQTPRERIAISAERLVATLVPGPRGALLSSARVDLEGVDIVSNTDHRISLTSGKMTAIADPEQPEKVALTFSATDLVPPAPAVRALSEANLAPEAVERIEVDAVVTFDRPWSFAALEGPRPQPTRIELAGSGLRWGELTLRVAGTLDVDNAGQAEGDLLVKATNWRELLAVAAASGSLPEGVARALESGLDLLSRLAGSPKTLDIPLSLSNGRMSMGVVPLGPAPHFWLP